MLNSILLTASPRIKSRPSLFLFLWTLLKICRVILKHIGWHWNRYGLLTSCWLPRHFLPFHPALSSPFLYLQSNKTLVFIPSKTLLTITRAPVFFLRSSLSTWNIFTKNALYTMNSIGCIFPPSTYNYKLQTKVSIPLIVPTFRAWACRDWGI